MGSESVNKRIRETICDLPDDDLLKMLNGPSQDYTPFARRVAEKELSRRRQSEAAKKNMSRVPDPAKHADCYVEIWSDKNFEGEYLRVEGPVELRALHLAVLDWADSISSLRVGPTAFLLVYAHENFKGPMMSFGPCQEIADLKEMKFNNEIDSVRLVNSMKVFDELRADHSNEPAAELLPPKGHKQRGRRKG